MPIFQKEPFITFQDYCRLNTAIVVTDQQITAVASERLPLRQRAPGGASFSEQLLQAKQAALQLEIFVPPGRRQSDYAGDRGPVTGKGILQQQPGRYAGRHGLLLYLLAVNAMHGATCPA